MLKPLKPINCNAILKVSKQFDIQIIMYDWIDKVTMLLFVYNKNMSEKEI